MLTFADLVPRYSDHVPYRNSKLTRLLQPSLAGNARISVICTINPDPSAISESTSTLLFAKRIKNVKVCLDARVIDYILNNSSVKRPEEGSRRHRCSH